MKNVRIWFVKKNSAKYISHLDLNRCMARVVNRAKLPIWYTEGFNPHPFITFSLPLSLGIQGIRESMDIRLTEDMDNLEVMDRLNSCLPDDIRVFDVTEQVMKPKEISYALFEVTFKPNNISLEKLESNLKEFINRENILTEKKSKSGMKTIDLKAEIIKYEIKLENELVKLSLTLPAGNTKNINPLLFINEFKKSEKHDFSYDITRLDMYNKDMESFT